MNDALTIAPNREDAQEFWWGVQPYFDEHGMVVWIQSGTKDRPSTVLGHAFERTNT